MAVNPILPSTFEMGSYFPNGVRVGPSNLANAVPDRFIDRNTITSNAPYGLQPNKGPFYNGPGMVQGSLATYRINPSPPANGPITAATLLSQATAGNYPMPLYNNNNQTDRPTQWFKSPKGLDVVQFDVPRSVQLQVTGLTTTTGTLSVTVRLDGLDRYGNLISCTKLLQVAAGANTNGVFTAETDVCFYQVIGQPVITSYTPATTGGANASLRLFAGTRLGLPYRLYQQGHIEQYSQWSVAVSSQGDNTYAAEVNGLYPAFFTGGPPLNTILSQREGSPREIRSGWNGTPTGLTLAGARDCRGWISPNTVVTVNQDTGAPTNGDDFQWAGPITVTMYVAGADILAQENAATLLTIKKSLVPTNTPPESDPWNNFGRTLFSDGSTDPVVLWKQNQTAIPTEQMLFGLAPFYAPDHPLL